MMDTIITAIVEGQYSSDPYPSCPGNASSADKIAYRLTLDEIEVRNKNKRITFRDDLIEACGLKGHPRAADAFLKASENFTPLLQVAHNLKELSKIMGVKPKEEVSADAPVAVVESTLPVIYIDHFIYSKEFELTIQLVQSVLSDKRIEGFFLPQSWYTVFVRLRSSEANVSTLQFDKGLLLPLGIDKGTAIQKAQDFLELCKIRLEDAVKEKLGQVLTRPGI